MTTLPPEDPSHEGIDFFLESDIESDDAELERIVTYGGQDDEGPDAGVREPRRPSPRSGSGSATQGTDEA